MLNSLTVSNGAVLAAWKPDYTMGNLTYPHVGLHEHTRSPWRLGVFAGGQFAWTSDFDITLKYLPDTVVTDVSLVNKRLGVTMRCHDFVHFRKSVLVKKMQVTNDGATGTEVRLFFHHDPYIDESADANTVLYKPENGSLVSYKENIYLLANVQVDGKKGFSSYACGHKGRPGKEGTWRDAEDGVLGGNAIAEGSVDSVGSVSFYLAPGETKVVWYWICFGAKYGAVKELDMFVTTQTPQKLMDATRDYWHYWVVKQLGTSSSAEMCFSHSPATERHEVNPGKMADLSDQAASLYRRSVLTVRLHCDKDGAIIAACDSNIYQFNNGTYGHCWPRDGAFNAASCDAAGHGEPSRKFFQWAGRTISDDGYFLHKYTSDGRFASSWHPWVDPQGASRLPIQEDETALPLVALWNHFKIHRCTELIYEGDCELYTRLIVPAGKFLMTFRDTKTGLPKESYDLWEERFGVSAFTIASVFAGLKAASRLTRPVDDDLATQFDTAAEEVKTAFLKHFYNEKLNRFVRLVNIKPDGTVTQDETIDSCMFAIWYFGLVPSDDPKAVRTMEAIEKRLWRNGPIGGYCRYEGDVYQGKENPWAICTLWVAQWHIHKAKHIDDLRRAKELIDWVVARANDAGLVAEQFDPETGAPLSVNPLAWSHATVVLTVREYCAKWEELSK